MSMPGVAQTFGDVREPIEDPCPQPDPGLVPSIVDELLGARPHRPQAARIRESSRRHRPDIVVG